VIGHDRLFDQATTVLITGSTLTWHIPPALNSHVWRLSAGIRTLRTIYWTLRRERSEQRPHLWNPHAATLVIGATFAILMLAVGAWSYPDMLTNLARGHFDGIGWRLILFLVLLVRGAGGWAPARPDRMGCSEPRAVAGNVLWWSTYGPGATLAGFSFAKSVGRSPQCGHGLSGGLVSRSMMACLIAGRLGSGCGPEILFPLACLSRSDWRKARAIMDISAWRCSPFQDRPSKWSRPSSSSSC